jgi:hypothetical protein
MFKKNQQDKKISPKKRPILFNINVLEDEEPNLLNSPFTQDEQSVFSHMADPSADDNV